MKKNVSSTLLALGFLTAGPCAPEAEEIPMAEQQLVTRSARVQSGRGYYVVAEGNGGDEVNCNRTAIGPWETFTLVK